MKGLKQRVSLAHVGGGIVRLTSPSVLRVCVLALLAVGASGVAHAQWSHTVSFRHAANTSLKVTEPEGFKASIVAEGETKSDTIPAIFSLSDQDAYVPLTVIAGDGQSFTVKVEVRARQQTEVRVKYAAASKTSSGSGEKFIGRLRNNTDRCKDHRVRGPLRFDFLLAGVQKGSFAVPFNKEMHNVELEGGTYNVRIFIKRADQGVFTFVRSEQLTIGKDGWTFGYGCP